MKEAEIIIKLLRYILKMVEWKCNRIQSKIDKIQLSYQNASGKAKDKFDMKLVRLLRSITIWSYISWWLRQFIEEMEEENRKFNNKAK